MTRLRVVDLARSAIFTLIAAASVTASTPGWAWGKTGHRIIGALAEPYLTPKARAGIKAILSAETIAEASTWPDFMRSSPDPFWQKTASPWHYATVPAGRTYAQVGAPTEGDAVTALARFAAVVRDARAPLADRQLALRFIVHIVCDFSQPFHVGDGSDRGGNDVKVTWFGKPTNLHAVWDSELVDDQQLSYSEYAGWLAPRLTPLVVRQKGTADPLTWIADSASVRATLYPADPKFSHDYVYQHKATMETQLVKGGVRLASYLNALFAS